MSGQAWQIGLAALVTALILLAMHWGPWKWKPFTARYVGAALAVLLPYSGLLMAWGYIDDLWAIWVIAIAGGAALKLAYFIDHYIAMRERLEAAERDMRILQEANDGTAPGR